MTDLLQRVEQQIQNRRLLKRGEKILVAVSGGIDSMVLLHVLDLLSKKNRWKIFIAHFNHQLRGRASDADEKLVRRTASRLKLPVVAGRADVKSFAKKSRLSIEMAARKLRHEFFASVARARKIKTIALAHHADDQVELFFLRLLRGAGGEGLAGMKSQSPSPVDKKIALIRPLLDLTKAELFQFARENKIRFREDATNRSSDFLRNRIRNELLPLLKKNYQSALAKAVLRSMAIVGAESDFVGDFAKHGLKNRKLLFEKLSVAIQRRVLQSRLAGIGVAADFDLIESLRQSPNRFYSVGSKISVARDKSGKIKLRAEPKLEFDADEIKLNLADRAGKVIFGGRKFHWTIKGGSQKRPPRQRQVEFFDAEKIGDEIILRHWRAGDRFQPIGMKSPVKLQDLFVNAKIPRGRRHDLVLAATKAGGIFWVEGLRISENFKITPETTRWLIWHRKNTS